MAEAVGLAASIIAVLEVAQKLTIMTRKYIKSYKNAPEEIKTLRDELMSLVGVLQTLRVEAEDDSEDSEDSDESSLDTDKSDAIPESLAIEGGRYGSAKMYSAI